MSVLSRIWIEMTRSEPLKCNKSWRGIHWLPPFFARHCRCFRRLRLRRCCLRRRILRYCLLSVHRFVWSPIFVSPFYLPSSLSIASFSLSLFCRCVCKLWTVYRIRREDFYSSPPEIAISWPGFQSFARDWIVNTGFSIFDLCEQFPFAQPKLTVADLSTSRTRTSYTNYSEWRYSAGETWNKMKSRAIERIQQKQRK